MSQVVLDRVKESELQASSLWVRTYRRTGFVKDIDLASGGDPEALMKVLNLSDMPQMGTALSANYPTMTLRQVFVRPSPFVFRRVNLELIYSNDAGQLLTQVIIRNRGFLGEYETSFVPGTRQRIRARGNLAGYDVPWDYIRMTLPRPMREISLSGVVYSMPPSQAIQTCTGYSNSAVWEDLGIGYWVITGCETDYNVRENYYTYQVTALTRCNEDWAHFGVLMQKETGKFVDVADADVTALTSATYNYGGWGVNKATHQVVSADDSGADAGIVRVDPFPTTDFGALFGFS